MTQPEYSAHRLIWTWGETKIHLGQPEHAGYDVLTLCGHLLRLANPQLSTPSDLSDPLLCHVCRDVLRKDYRDRLPAANESHAILL